MPTCFVATYGSGKPVIGILGEFDALPMISQKGRVTKQDPLVAGAPGPRLRAQHDVHGGIGRGHRGEGSHG